MTPLDQFSPPENENRDRNQRSLNPDPDFVTHPYSTGWAFALPASFRSALDIQWTGLQKNLVKSYHWTQGRNYAFSVGDVIYDSIAGYEPWLIALRSIKTCLTVVSASPATANERIVGHVEFQVAHPNEEKTNLVSGPSYRGTQGDFVQFLQTGYWNSIHHSQL